VRNNRRKKERDEDLHLHVPGGPVYYREDTHRVWTNDVVHVYDYRSKPKEHTVTGKGMTMELLTEMPPERPAARKPQREAITGAKWIELQTGVTMVMQLDGNKGFLAGDQNKKASAADAKPTPEAKDKDAAKPRERTELTITTPGKFRYEVYKDHDLAHFQ